MRLRRLFIRDFISHGNTEIEFTDEPVVFTGRNFDHSSSSWSNGAGKSTILYAICWALYGMVPPGVDKKDDVIRRGCQNAHVELRLVGPKGVLDITRSKAVGGAEQLQAWINSHRVAGERDEVQTTLNRVYGVSWKTFCNTVFLGPDSDTAQFVRAKPAERAKILSELVNTAPFTAGAEKAGREIAALETRRGEILGSLRTLEMQFVNIRANLDRLTVQLNSEQHSQRTREANVNAQIAELDREALGIAQRLRTPPEGNVVELRAKLNLVNEQADSAKNQTVILSARISGAVPASGNPCPTCQQPFSEMARLELLRKREDWARELRMRQTELYQAQAEVANLQGLLQKHTDWETIRVQLAKRLDDIKATAYAIKMQLENKTLAVLHTEIERLHDQRKQLEAIQNDYNTELHDINTRLPVLTTIRKGFQTDIRNILLDDIRVAMQLHVDKYLEILAEHELTVRFPQLSRSGEEKFLIEVQVGNSPNPLRSVGESYRVQLAVLLGLRRVLSYQQVSPFDFLMIDDPLFGVDQAGFEAFRKLLNHLTIHQPQVLITAPWTQEQATQLLGVKTLLVERTGRVSRVLQ